MKYIIKFIVVSSITIGIVSCEKDERNIANVEEIEVLGPGQAEVIPTDINSDGFEFLSKMQGHWVGSNLVIADEFEWFAFDYRAISPSQIHGIFEGGTMGNLLTSFFVTDFKNTRTIMARNGGLLNGIYRSSYFVMDSVRHDANGDFYRLVDAKGGTNTMWMELRFDEDSLFFNAYTSGLGAVFPPTRHMTFKAKKENLDLSQASASDVGFPQNIPAWDFSEGFIEEYLNASEGASSATFLAYDGYATDDVFTLASNSGDPFTITDHPHLAYLQIEVNRNPEIVGKRLWLHLSKDPLTDENGYYISEEAFNSVLLFPEIAGDQDELLITYLHPGDYYVTIIADVNDDGYISEGDFSHSSEYISILPEAELQLTIENITTEN